MNNKELSNKIKLINNAFGKKVLYASPSSNEAFTGLIASEVHPITDVVGLDLQDGHELTFLAHVNDIQFIPDSSFKSPKNWENIERHEICYRAELQDEDEYGYTKQDIINECRGKEKTAKTAFELLNWQHLSTILQEWFEEGEMDENYNLIGNY